MQISNNANSKQKPDSFPDGLTLLTRPPRTLGTFPAHIVRYLKSRIRPLGINEAEETAMSLSQGLIGLHEKFQVDPWVWRMTNTVGVLASSEALQWALSAKKRGLVKKIIAGPHIVKSPADYNYVIKDLSIDAILVSSEHEKSRWITQDQYFDRKLLAWTAGAHDQREARDIHGACLVYSKSVPEKLFSKIMETLWSHKVPIIISKYGRFRPHEYYRLLGKSKFVIYLSNFEGQERGLFEAWLSNVPTLIYQPDTQSPYANEACGLTFTDEKDFEAKLIEFQEHYASYTPRAYALNHHTDVLSASAYLAILKNL